MLAWPSHSFAAQQTSIASHGTLWNARALPGASEATVNIGPQASVTAEGLLARGRKRPFPGPPSNRRADQACLWSYGLQMHLL